MSESPLQTALHGLTRHLEIAAAEGSDSGGEAPNLAATVCAACRQARALAVPPEVRQCLDSILSLFGKSLAAGSHAMAAERALALVAPLRDPAFGDDLLGRSPACFSGIGPKRTRVLSKRGIKSVLDLLFLLPVRYDDRRSLVRIAELEVGRRATFVARVVGAKSTHRRGRFGRMLEVVVGDEDGTVGLKWFRGVEALEPVLREGVEVGVTGDVRRYRFNKEIVHPEVEVLGGAEDEEGGASDRLDSLRRVVPRYPALEGIPPRTLRRLVESAVEEYGDLVRGFLPPDLVRDENLPGAAEALQEIHFPPRDVDVEMLDPGRSIAYRRLVLEELYLLEIGLALRRSDHFSRPGIALGTGDRATPLPAVALPFALTAAQERCWNEIRGDLGRPQPMSRLLQGDVGCGKTAVAFLGAVAVAGEGHQVAFVAPTELLAEQHIRSLGRLSESSGEGRRLRVALLTASLPRADREVLRARIRAGEVDVVVGTHALLQEQMEFASLALVVIDEQHRFGVLQRAALSERGPGGRTPHTLVMTATPIPRTLALTLYGDLDVSVIDEMPPGRSPVETLLLRDGEGGRILERVRSTAARGEQVYIVYPLVETSEKVDLRAATESARRIRAALPEFNVDLVHGRLDAAARHAAMRRFDIGETQVLVATSVIEVGVDVPNATLMVIEHAERFGLAQLHQLRGRIGRGELLGTCVLVARGGGEDSEARIRALLETNDGFRIADADLRIRGPGEFLGTQQHGSLPDLRIADLVRDVRLVSLAREEALAAVRRDPGLRGAPELRAAVEERWGDRLVLARVG